MSCCRCNWAGTCKSCSCVKDGRACSNCLPKRLGSCVNCVNAALGAHIPTPTPNSAHPPPVAALQSTSTSTSQPRPTHNSPEHPLTAMTQRPTSAHQPLTAARIDLLPSLASIFEQETSTLQHVPKGSRDEWASVVGDVCSTIVADPADMYGWVKLFMLPRCVLASPVRGGRTHWRNTVKLVKSCIRRWRAGDYRALWADMMEDEDKQARSRKKSKAVPLEQFRRANARRARCAAEDGQYRKAF